MWGIDVSRHQEFIDWKQVKNQGIQFAIIKAMGETTHQPDSRFDYNYMQADALGLQKGTYLYVIAKDVPSAIREANDMLRTLHGRKLERGIWLDLEDKKIEHLSKDMLTLIVDTEAEILRNGGYEVGIYTNLDWYLRIMDKDKLIKTYDWWIARYPKHDTGDLKPVLFPGNEFRMWQYSSKGTIPGIRGPVDLNIDIDDLNKSNETIADEILLGKWGNGQMRLNRLTAAGYSAITIQQIVMQKLHDRKFYPKYNGFSMKIDQVFTAINVEPEYIGNKDNRRPIAEANGISGYNGTLTQNLKLIFLAKLGELKRI